MNKLTKNLNKNSGFTLIELIIVIAVIAILAALALPRYIALRTQANTAKAATLYGSIRAAAALTKGQCVGGTGNTTCDTVLGSVSMEGANNISTRFSYPSANVANGIQLAAGITAADYTITLPAAVGGTATFSVPGVSVPASCQVSYTAPTAVDLQPAIVLTTTACN